MIKTAFRFLHAADLFLELPVEGVGESAEPIEKRLLSAPVEAARRLFQLARAEVVDFVLLSGNVVNPNASGPGPLLFLVEQFQLLADAGIPVYWAGSSLDAPDHWPAAIYLPENVHVFRTANVEEQLFYKGSIPVARLLGLSLNHHRPVVPAAQFTSDSTGLYTIVVANGEVNPTSARRCGIPFWALGGSAQRKTYQLDPVLPKAAPAPKQEPLKPLFGDPKATWKSTVRSSAPIVPQDDDELDDFTNLPVIVHYPGPTLARNPEETEHYGATLVDVSLDGITTLTFLPTSPVRFVEERIELEPGSSVKQLRAEMIKRLGEFRAVKSRDDLMISWVVDCPGGNLSVDLRNTSVGEQLLEELRTDYGIEPPICWSVAITTTLPENFSSNLYDQKTILGDYLRAIRHYQMHPYEPINLLPFLPKDYKDLPFGKRLPLALPAEVHSDVVLKRLLSEHPEKAIRHLERVLAEKIQKRRRKETPAKESEETTTVEPLRRRSRRKTKRLLKQLKLRLRTLKGVLREAAALGWDQLGSEEPLRSRKHRSAPTTQTEEDDS